MKWTAVIQSVFYVIGSILSLCSIYAIFEARKQYKRGLKQRAAETLLELEKRLSSLEDILVLVDPEGKRYELELKPSVEKSLQGLPQSQRSNEDRELILRLDRFLRFMLLLTALVKYDLLKSDALQYQYWYWFAAIRQNPHLKAYTVKYFPTLAGALGDERLTPPGPQNLNAIH